MRQWWNGGRNGRCNEDGLFDAPWYIGQIMYAPWTKGLSSLDRDDALPSSSRKYVPLDCIAGLFGACAVCMWVRETTSGR